MKFISSIPLFSFLKNNITGRIKRLLAKKGNMAFSLSVDGLKSLNGFKVLYFKNQTKVKDSKMSSLA